MGKIIRKAVLETERAPLGMTTRHQSESSIENTTHSEHLTLRATQSLRSEIEMAVRKELATEAIAAFEAEHNRGRSEGFAKGQEEGKALAKQEAEREQVRLRSAIEASLTSVSSAVKSHETLMHAELSSLVLVCLVKILGQSAPTAQSIEHAVANVLASAHAAGRVRVRIHPDDLKLLTETCDPQELTTAAQEIELLPDASLLGGGCIAETGVGQFDASIDSQLRILHACILESRSKPANCSPTSEITT